MSDEALETPVSLSCSCDTVPECDPLAPAYSGLCGVRRTHTRILHLSALRLPRVKSTCNIMHSSNERWACERAVLADRESCRALHVRLFDPCFRVGSLCSDEEGADHIALGVFRRGKDDAAAPGPREQGGFNRILLLQSIILIFVHANLLDVF